MPAAMITMVSSTVTIDAAVRLIFLLSSLTSGDRKSCSSREMKNIKAKFGNSQKPENNSRKLTKRKIEVRYLSHIFCSP